MSPCGGTSRRQAPYLAHSKSFKAHPHVQPCVTVSSSNLGSSIRHIRHLCLHDHERSAKLQSAKCWCRLCRRGSLCSSRRWQVGRARHPPLPCLTRSGYEKWLQQHGCKPSDCRATRDGRPVPTKTALFGPTCCGHTVVAVCVSGRQGILGSEPGVCLVLEVHLLEIALMTMASIHVACRHSYDA